MYYNGNFVVAGSHTSLPLAEHDRDQSDSNLHQTSSKTVNCRGVAVKHDPNAGCRHKGGFNEGGNKKQTHRSRMRK